MAIIDTTASRELELAAEFASLVPKAAAAATARTQDTGEDPTPGAWRRDVVRQSLLPKSDEHAKERVVGFRDIVPLSFMERGLRAGSSVCRVRLADSRGAAPDYGTAFLVAPGIAITNHHVLRDESLAAGALFEFDAEVDLNWVDRTRRVFAAQPRVLFWTDPLLDITFVGVSPVAHDGTPLSEYGFLPLMEQSGKALPGEYVSIIQHPDGGLKQVVLRENQIIHAPDAAEQSFIHYRADTEPGSSGAPVFNDQWDVVAVHHLAVQARDGDEQPLNRRGGVWAPEQGEDEKLILVNEGVRISAVFGALREAARSDRDAAELLQQLQSDQSPSRPAIMLSTARIEDDVPEGLAFEATRYDGLKGFESDFLEGFEVPLPELGAQAQADAAPVSGGGNVLHYTHFSIVMSKSRRFALYTAVNIDGELRKPPTSDKAWRRDPRIDDKYESDNALYLNDDDEPVDLQRGHLVRRLDPVWGETQAEVDRGNQDTFHYTNATPMAQKFNDQLWGNLEDYILERAERVRHRVSVFTGPIFENSDPEYGAERVGGPWQVPKYFWKVVVYMRGPGDPAVAAFRMDQSDYVAPLFERYTPLSEAEARTYQEPLTKIERWTGLSFPALRQYDRFGGSELRRGRPRLIRRLSDITL